MSHVTSLGATPADAVGGDGSAVDASRCLICGLRSSLPEFLDPVVRTGPLPDGRVCGVVAFLCVRSCLAVEPSMPYLPRVASLCPSDKGGFAHQADDCLRCCPWVHLQGHERPETVLRASKGVSPQYFGSHTIGAECPANLNPRELEFCRKASMRSCAQECCSSHTFRQQNPRHTPWQHGMLRVHPQSIVRQYFVVRRRYYIFSKVPGHMTKELTASAPSATGNRRIS